MAKLKYYRVPMVVAVVSLGLMMFSWTQYSQLTIARKDLADDGQELEAINRKVAFLKSQDSATLAHNKEVVNRALPGEKPVFAAVTGLRGAARASGVLVSELTSAPGQISTGSATTSKQTAQPGNVGTLVVEMGVEGSLPAINDYLLRVSEMVPLVGLESVEISVMGDSPEGEEANYRADLELQVYWMLPAAPAKTGTSAPVAGLSANAEGTLISVEGFKFYGLEL